MSNASGLVSLLPDVEQLLLLPPEDVGAILMEYLNGLPKSNRESFHPSNILNEPAWRERFGKQVPLVLRVMAEAWGWLEREGLILPQPRQRDGWMFISRRGAKLQNRSAVQAYRRAGQLPRDVLHPSLIEKAWPAFARGDYDVAVHQSMKDVEVAVRTACGYPPEKIGVNLMREAFHCGNGPLADTELPAAEQEAGMALFAGAIGMYKNSTGHRDVMVGADEAVEVILLASRLLKIVDQRRPKKTGET